MDNALLYPLPLFSYTFTSLHLLYSPFLPTASPANICDAGFRSFIKC